MWTDMVLNYSEGPGEVSNYFEEGVTIYFNLGHINLWTLDLRNTFTKAKIMKGQWKFNNSTAFFIQDLPKLNFTQNNDILLFLLTIKSIRCLKPYSYKNSAISLCFLKPIKAVFFLETEYNKQIPNSPILKFCPKCFSCYF